MRRICCLLFLLIPALVCFAQNHSEYTPFIFSDLSESFNYSPRLEMFRPVPLASESEQSQSSISIFANSPQWVKDLRRGEIVFFGTLPFTVFFTRTIMDIIRMGQNNWDQRYAPWPFQSAGAAAINGTDVFWMFAFACSASLTVSVIDHQIVKNKRKAASAADY
ncbi:MAG: hypothetical protein FWG07_09865 [Treponema sp.]|nr:hypothetical protein [Treponema sp.]